MLTMNTPYPELSREFWDDFDKCAYWVEKETKRRKDIKEAMEKAYYSGRVNVRLPYIDYTSKNDNRWRNYYYLQAIGHGGRVASRYESVCYWETLGSFGVFMALQFQGVRYIAIMPGHFWQRLAERDSRYPLNGITSSEAFIRDHLCMQLEVLPPREGERRRGVTVMMNGCVTYGVVMSEEHHVIEIRTVLSERQLTGLRLRAYRGKDIPDEVVKRGYQEITSLAELYPDKSLAELYPLATIDGQRLILDIARWANTEEGTLAIEQRSAKALSAAYAQ